MKGFASALALSLLLSAAAHAAEPVVAAKDQQALLKSDDPQLAANKKLVFDMWRTFLSAHHIDEADKFLAPEYHQHNPNAETGLEGVKAYFRALNMKPTPIRATHWATCSGLRLILTPSGSLKSQHHSERSWLWVSV